MTAGSSVSMINRVGTCFSRLSIHIRICLLYTSLVSSNIVILPEDTVAGLDTWMPESVDLFTDHMNIPELKSGFINQYNIEDNVRMIKVFYPKTEHIAFISDNTYGGVTMQALVRKEMKKFPEIDLILMDGRRHTIYTIVQELRHLPENTVIMVGTWRVDMHDGYFMRNATYALSLIHIYLQEILLLCASAVGDSRRLCFRNIQRYELRHIVAD